MPSLLSYAVSITLGLVTWGASLVIYRIYFSPLSKFPGPKLAAATLWYEFYFNVIKDGGYIWEIQRMHAKYGPIIRINPHELHVDDPDYYDELYAGGSSKRDKYEWFVAGAGAPGSSLQTTGHDMHRLRRSALNPFFSKRSIVSIEPILNKKIESLATLFHNHINSKEPVNFRVVYVALTLDIISHYCFGCSWDCLKDPVLARHWSTLIHDLFELTHLMMHFPFLPVILSRLPDIVAHPFTIHQRNTRKHVQEIISFNEKPVENTIFHELRDSNLPPEEKSLIRLTNEGYILIGAGSETTASVLSVLSYHLIMNPPVLQSLREELDAVIPDADTVVTWTQLEQLPYLSAVINEALRISSPATIRLPRISPNTELEFQGWSIPRGTPVSMSYFFIHHSAAIFPSPEEFKPSRWLEQPTTSVPRLERYLVPYSKGSRNCLGINLAQAELYLTVAHVFRKFDFELFETDRGDVDIARDHFTFAPKAGSKGIRARVVGERV